jgi:hypothetical protein
VHLRQLPPTAFSGYQADSLFGDQGKIPECVRVVWRFVFDVRVDDRLFDGDVSARQNDAAFVDLKRDIDNQIAVKRDYLAEVENFSAIFFDHILGFEKFALTEKRGFARLSGDVKADAVAKIVTVSFYVGNKALVANLFVYGFKFIFVCTQGVWRFINVTVLWNSISPLEVGSARVADIVQRGVVWFPVADFRVEAAEWRTVFWKAHLECCVIDMGQKCRNKIVEKDFVGLAVAVFFEPLRYSAINKGVEWAVGCVRAEKGGNRVNPRDFAKVKGKGAQISAFDFSKNQGGRALGWRAVKMHGAVSHKYTEPIETAIRC